MNPENSILKEIYRINSHLPAKRPTLAQLLEENRPSVRLRDGSEHSFRRAELERIKGLLDPGEDTQLLLPIVLEIVSDFRGYFRVRGKVAVKVIDKLLGSYDPLDEPVERLYPRYLLSRVRRELPTTTTYAFIAE
ncbi:hypothetical protein TEU_03230 [Thermococcus eurythermalis]|uniref:UPF0216 protein TEU_03230 n=1 Tax=Thermococcus eurythermalis TaxID=1505907 RepID=A0A097QSH8_9EURY|nr:DUF61 family protein [Thermococcus eurythermalis]AIU69438.1 hypothetical protein TEU_03230 [Thermococcus eurythermalis]